MEPGETAAAALVKSTVEALNRDLASLGHVVTAELVVRSFPRFVPPAGLAEREGIWAVAADDPEWRWETSEPMEIVEISIEGEVIGGRGAMDVAWGIVDTVQDGISERIAFGEPWPVCPAAGAHPMNFDSPSGTWRCPEHGVEVPLGSLHST